MPDDPNELGETSAMDLTDRRHVEAIMQVGGPFIHLARALLAHDNYLVNLSDRIEAHLGLDDDVQPVSPDPEPEHVTCPTCDGSYEHAWDSASPCDRCGGEGRLRVWVGWWSGSEHRLVEAGETRPAQRREWYLFGGQAVYAFTAPTPPYPILVAAPPPEQGVERDEHEPTLDDDEMAVMERWQVESIARSDDPLDAADAYGTFLPLNEPQRHVWSCDLCGKQNTARSLGRARMAVLSHLRDKHGHPDRFIDPETAEQTAGVREDRSEDDAHLLARQVDALTEALRVVVSDLADEMDEDFDSALGAVLLSNLTPEVRWALHNLTDEAG